jgi:hypothetical protein
MQSFDVCDANDNFEVTAFSLSSHHRSSDGTLYQLARIKSVGSDKLSKYVCGGANQSASQKSEPHGWTPLYATLSLQAESERWDLFIICHWPSFGTVAGNADFQRSLL